MLSEPAIGVLAMSSSRANDPPASWVMIRLFRGGCLDKRAQALCKMFCTRLHLPVIISYLSEREMMPQRTFKLKLFARRHLAENDHRKIALATLTSEIGMTIGLLSLITTLSCSSCRRWDAAQGP